MGELILKILGVNAEGGAGIDSIGFNFMNKGPAVWIIILALLLSGFVVFLYLKEIESVSRRLRLALAAIRIVIIFFLLTLFLDPVLVIEQTSFYKPFAVVMVDKSQSMSIKDDLGVRMDIANNILNEKAQNMLNKLEKNYRMKMYSFSNEPLEIDYEKAKSTSSIRFGIDKSGATTSVGGALKKAMEDLAGQPVAGVVIISDGGNNSGDDPVEAARVFGEKGIPLYPVGVGDHRIKQDVAVTNILSEERGIKGDIVNLTATVESRGYKAITIPVRVMLKGRILKEEQVQLSEKNNKAEVNLNFLAENIGENDYAVFIPPQAGEVSEVNNVKIARINVTDDKMKVLYVDGYPRWLYRYIVRSLKRDKGIALSGLLETSEAEGFCEGSLPISGFPRTKEELFEYDVIIIGDVSKNYFKTAQLENIRAFVAEKGGGVFFLPGDRWALATGRIPELEKMFPVELENGVYNSSIPVKIKLETDGKSSPVFALEDVAAQNEKTWKNLEGVYTMLKSGKEKPGAIVYVKYIGAKAGSNVFAASQRVGNGKVFLFTSDDIWRWRFRTENKYFYKIFGQALRWLVPEKASSEDKNLKLTTDKKKYVAGEKVFVSAKVTVKGFSEMKIPAFFAGSDGKKESFTLVSVGKDSTLFTGEFVPAAGGEHKIWVEHPKFPPEVSKVKAEIVVEIPNMEYENPELNEELMKKIAEVSKGKYFRASAASGVADSVIKTKPKVTIKTEKGLKASPFVIIFFILLAGTEWFIRRNKNMM
jgi:Ca2+/Na+ antiporter